MRRLLVGALIAIVGAGVRAGPVQAGDKDCADFKTWRQAQKFYKKKGGPRKDPHRLDADRDGVACEDLR